MYQVLPPSFQPPLPLFFCIVTCWDQSQVLIWQIDGYSIKPPKQLVPCDTISAWQVAESQGRDQRKASVVWCAEAESSTGVVQSIWICHYSSYQWLKTMGKTIFPHFTHFLGCCTVSVWHASRRDRTSVHTRLAAGLIGDRKLNKLPTFVAFVDLISFWQCSGTGYVIMELAGNS